MHSIMIYIYILYKLPAVVLLTKAVKTGPCLRVEHIEYFADRNAIS